MWCLWKERNGRIFHDKRNSIEKVWHMVKDKLISSIQSMQWNDEETLILADEIHIMEFWGPEKTHMDGLR